MASATPQAVSAAAKSHTGIDGHLKNTTDEKGVEQNGEKKAATTRTRRFVEALRWSHEESPSCAAKLGEQDLTPVQRRCSL